MKTLDYIVLALAVLGVAAVWWYTRKREEPATGALEEDATANVYRVPGGPERVVVTPRTVPERVIIGDRL